MLLRVNVWVGDMRVSDPHLVRPKVPERGWISRHYLMILVGARIVVRLLTGRTSLCRALGGCAGPSPDSL